MSEPASYALHVAVQPDHLRDWLVAPCPAPDTWQDWEELSIPSSLGVFERARGFTGQPIGGLLEALVSPAPGCWHFAWADGQLELVALQGSANWAEHILFLTAFRALERFGAGPGAAVSHGYVWREGITDWGLIFRTPGQTRISAELPADAQARLDELVLPIVEAARDGEAGPAQSDFESWRTG